jgi:hypothetical protein
MKLVILQIEPTSMIKSEFLKSMTKIIFQFRARIRTYGVEG